MCESAWLLDAMSLPELCPPSAIRQTTTTKTEHASSAIRLHIRVAMRFECRCCPFPPPSFSSDSPYVDELDDARIGDCEEATRGRQRERLQRKPARGSRAASTRRHCLVHVLPAASRRDGKEQEQKGRSGSVCVCWWWRRRRRRSAAAAAAEQQGSRTAMQRVQGRRERDQVQLSRRQSRIVSPAAMQLLQVLGKWLKS